MKLKPIHYVMILAVAGLIYMLFFSKPKTGGGGGGGGGSPPPETKEQQIARLTAQTCDIVEKIKAKYGENKPDMQDPLVVQLISDLTQIKLLDGARPPCIPA